jgi:hypothetical protein
LWPQVGRGRPKTSLWEDVWEHSSAPRDRAVFRRPQLCKASSCGAFCILDRLRGATATFVSMIFSCSLGRKLDHFLGFRNSAQELRRSSQEQPESSQEQAEGPRSAQGAREQPRSTPEGTPGMTPWCRTLVRCFLKFGVRSGVLQPRLSPRRASKYLVEHFLYRKLEENFGNREN